MPSPYYQKLNDGRKRYSNFILFVGKLFPKLDSWKKIDLDAGIDITARYFYEPATSENDVRKPRLRY